MGLNVLFIVGVYKGYEHLNQEQLTRFNRMAWKAGYRERGIPVPPSGPREGYWGSRINTKLYHPALGWVEQKVHLSGLLELDAQGMQHVVPKAEAKSYIWILGSSTAFGAYASSIEKTYFYRLGALLADASHPVNITVFAAGGWKSSQELKALEMYALGWGPSLVIFLNGLNDLVLGSNAHTPLGVPTKTLDGSEWTIFYHEHDYRERVSFYLENMRNARDLLRQKQVTALFALQPALFEKRLLSPIEQTLEEISLAPHAGKGVLRQSYEEMRKGLAKLGQAKETYFLDCSRIFDAEKATMFTDFWHFPDPGHEILARFLAQILLPILQRTPPQNGRHSPW